jgi:peptidoglycan hydrolase-like protein with peptidoglycan-binding domain
MFFSATSDALARGILTPRSGQDQSEKTEEANYTQNEIRELVEDEFGENHPMVSVARCESSFRQYAGDGEVLRNPESDAIGIFQILEGLHEEPAEELGIDIFSAEGNVGYARELYDSFGLEPWSPSSLCWDDGSVDEVESAAVDTAEKDSTRVPVRVRSDDKLELKTADDTPYQLVDSSNTQEQPSEDQSPDSSQVITKKLVSGVTDPQVKKLQELLNQLGYRLSGAGPGSPGEETDFFGAKTRSAVQRFQCDNDIVCSGSRYTTGYGLVGDSTRTLLNHKTAEIDGFTRRSPGGVLIRSDSNQADKQSGDSESSYTDSNTALTDQISEIAQRVNKLQAQIARQ